MTIMDNKKEEYQKIKLFGAVRLNDVCLYSVCYKVRICDCLNLIFLHNFQVFPKNGLQSFGIL